MENTTSKRGGFDEFEGEHTKTYFCGSNFCIQHVCCKQGKRPAGIRRQGIQGKLERDATVQFRSANKQRIDPLQQPRIQPLFRKQTRDWLFHQCKWKLER